MKNFIYGGVLAVGLLFSSCNDALDIDPNDSYSDATVWQDQNLIKMFVNDQYGALIGSDDFYRYSFFSDESYQKYNNNGCNYVRENILTSDNIGAVSDLLNYWNTGYRYLHNLNLFFTKLLQKSEMRKEIVIELSYKGFSRASDYS